MRGVSALEEGVRALAAADAGDARHAHVLVAAQCSHANYLGPMRAPCCVDLHEHSAASGEKSPMNFLCHQI